MHRNIAKLIGGITLALAGTALAADPWMVRDIAHDTGLSTAQVYHVIGPNYATIEHMYTMHPSQRGYIQLVVRDYSERGLTMEPGLRLDRARRVAVQAR